MATSEWLREMRQAAGAAHGTTPTAAISRPRDATDAPTAPTASPQAADAEGRATGSPTPGTAQAGPQNAPQRTQRAFTAPTDAARDYRAMYAALFRFHERHSPPTPGDDDGALYWAATSDDMTATAEQFDNDPFIIDLLCVVFAELEREYKTIRQQAAGA